MEQVDVNQLELDSFVTILNETVKRYNPSETLEIIVIEDEITYMYKKNAQDLRKQVTEGTFYVCETQSSSQDILNDTIEPNISTSGAIDMDGGIGGRAVLTSQSSHTFSAKVYSSGFSTNGATHDDGTKNPNHLSFYNYIGLSAPFQADLGLKWSNLNGGWRPYYCKRLKTECLL